MLTVALTGGIATGKSIVAEVLENLGCFVHHADQTAHALIEPEKPAWEAIVSHFGEKILHPDRTVNRTKLGEIVFADVQERQFLNQLIHPLVMQKKKEIIQNLRNEGAYKIFVSEAALTIEAGYAHFYDRIIVTHCKKTIQAARLMDRDKISRREALRKIQSQMDPAEKMRFADYRIDTSTTIRSTIEQTEVVFRNLMMDYQLLYGNRF